MPFLNKIRKWSIENKRIFSILMALFLTILIIVLNLGINSFWKKDTPKTNYAQTEAIDSMQKSFQKIFEQTQPALDQLLGISTADTATQTGEIVDQINSTSSSLVR